jgi:cation diffusion facilitator CzcD-associated flavoprotein CzcO
MSGVLVVGAGTAGLATVVDLRRGSVTPRARVIATAHGTG